MTSVSCRTLTESPRWMSQWNANSGPCQDSGQPRKDASLEQVRGQTNPLRHLFFRPDGQPNEVWRGDTTLPFHKQGVTISGTCLGHPALRESCRPRKSSREDPSDARFAVCLALVFVLRCIKSKLHPSCVHPEQSFHFAVRHDAGQRVRRTVVARRSVANGHSAVLFGRFGTASHGILGQLG